MTAGSWVILLGDDPTAGRFRRRVPVEGSHWRVIPQEGDPAGGVVWSRRTLGLRPCYRRKTTAFRGQTFVAST
jgi:hypothetical protein